MRNLFFILMAIGLLTSCSEENSGHDVAMKENIVENAEIKNFAKNQNNLQCNENTIDCVIDNAIRCSINHKQKFCNRDILPQFIFMEDPTLKRPKNVSYQIIKTKEIDEHTTEVYTKMSCDGNWFGLCNGNIIYVLQKSDNTLKLQDIYALQQF